MKNRWTVITIKIGENKIGTPLMQREYIYGDSLDEYIECTEAEIKDITVIPYEEWQANDFAEILSKELETANYHSFVELPYIIFQAIREQRLEFKFEDILMKNICESIYETI